MSGRTLVFGDIHGCHVAFETLLSELQVAAGDTVVLLGDVVDRGPGTRQVIERLLELRAQCRLIFVMGNHEEMMLDGLARGKLWAIWMANGGREALDSYGGSPGIPAEHVEFLHSAEKYWETEREIFVHANLEPGIELPDQTPVWLRWTRFTGREQPHPSGRRVICGHTPQMSGFPAVIPGWVCLDTLAFGPGWLTCLDVATDVIFQANQAAKFRSGPL